MATACTAAWGWRLPSRLAEIARNVSDRVRRFNRREGLTPADERLPDRFFDEPPPETGTALQRDEPEPMRREYHELRGWDEQGRLTSPGRRVAR
ncbi:MAG: aldehyde ferredoxin oxidoreductase C-terminal domain-containing protein [Deferrisomatales bacterium]|nr:aldehyde ferredoxin oxidoreductase C-terminal domain-containing protein [Deferrisomatales bacterium]